VRKALDRHAKKLARKLDALEGDLADARRGPEWRGYAEALLAYAHEVPARASRVKLADPGDPSRTLEIELDPSVGAPANAARYFKRAAKAERALREIPPRIAAVKREHAGLHKKLEAAAEAEHLEGDDYPADSAHLELERVLAGLSASTREALRAPEPLPRRKLGLAAADAAAPDDRKQPTTPAPKRSAPDMPAKFAPWRFRSTEGWDVLIGRSSEANDHLTLHIARPEDYWFHAHGCPGSHVVLRRGKGSNEPSKATLLEVASWAAFHSKARSAGKVPVIYTQKKYVRKPRGAKPGTVYVEREKMIMVRPVEPPKEQMSDAESR
jgi:predicted ribosome quality control (RQC) complex YloA/Tae2 family protein